MKIIPLLPNRFKKLGWVLLIAPILFLIVDSVLDVDSEMFTFNIFSILSSVGLGDVSWFTVIKQDISYTLFSCLFISGGLLIMFSKERAEDEFIQSIRLNALMWSVLVHFVLLMIAFLSVYGLPFLNIVVYNTSTVLVIFILRFYYLLYRNGVLSSEK
jgi:FlaA1/EpsC-like NDP-sugar epimerase